MSTSTALDPVGPPAARSRLPPHPADNSASAPRGSSRIDRHGASGEQAGPSRLGLASFGRKRPRSTTAALTASEDESDDAGEPGAASRAHLVTPQAAPNLSRLATRVQLSESPSGISRRDGSAPGQSSTGRQASRRPLQVAMLGSASATEERHKRRRSATDSSDDDNAVADEDDAVADEDDEGETPTRARIASVRAGSSSCATRRRRPTSVVEHDGASDDDEPMDVDLPIPPAARVSRSSWLDSPSHAAHRPLASSSTVASPLRLSAPTPLRSSGSPYSPSGGSPSAALASTTSVHATTSAYRSPFASASASTALPLSMRRRPPLVRNATAVPAPLTPAISSQSVRPPTENDLHYFHPTPPASVGPPVGAVDRFGPLRRHLEEASPTSAVSLEAGSRTSSSRTSGSQTLPRRSGAMDASGRLRGPSRGANESWLGIRRSPSPPPALPTLGLAALATHGRFSPPVTPVPEGSSGPSGRSSARSWAPIGDDDGHLARPPSPAGSAVQGIRERRSWLASLSADGPSTAPVASSSLAAGAPSLRPFRLRPQAVRPLQPVTTSPSSSATARRTSLLAQLGSANEAEEALGSEFVSSTAYPRSRFDGLHAETGARRRWTAALGSLSEPETTTATSSESPWSASVTGSTTPPSPPPFSAFRPFLLGSEGPRDRPPPPTLSFLRPAQLPLSSTSSEAQALPAAVWPTTASLASHRSQPAPPVLTAAFSFGEDSDSESSASDMGDPLPVRQRPPPPPVLTPQTRLPVMLSSGLHASRVDAGSTLTGSGALPSFASTHASDWSSLLPSPDDAGLARRVPTLRPYGAAGHGFGERLAASAVATGGNASPTPVPDFQSATSSPLAPSFFSSTSGSGVARTSLSSDQASTSTASVRTGEQPFGAGSRLAEYLSRHSERRRRLLPGLVEAEEREAERQEDDDWTVSLLDWFTARPNSSAEPAELQQAEEQLAARRRRLHELRRSRLLVAPSASSTDGESIPSLVQTPNEPPPTAPMTTSSVWDALFYPSPSASESRPPATAATTFSPERWVPVSPTAAAAFGPGFLAPRSSRETIIQELLRQISADLSSLSSRPPAQASSSPPFPFRHERLGPPRRRDGSGWTSTASSGQQHPPPMPLGLGSLFSSLASPASAALGTDLLTEDEIDFSYESLIELSARVPAVVRATPGWVIEGLSVCSYRDQALKVAGDIDKRCAICLDDYVGHDLTTTSPCGHFLHKGCLEEWLRASHVCPLCRADVVPPSSDGDVAYSTVGSGVRYHSTPIQTGEA